MAVAVQSSGSSSAKQSDGSLGLLTMSIIGALIVIGAAALVLNIIPTLFGSGTPKRPMGIVALQMLSQAAALVGLGYAVAKYGAPLRKSGVRGGVFFTLISAGILTLCGFGLYRLAAKGFSFGGVVAMIVLAIIVALVIQFFRTGRFHAWAHAMDEGNWFDTTPFKRTQGLKVRRLTTLGILLLCGSGIWTLWTHSYLPHNNIVKVDGVEKEDRYGDWVVGATEIARPPHRVGGITILPDLAFTIPLILTALTVWFAWRAVNYPPFADFLIATEAEINKVSWSSRKSLFRDTIVVLVSLVLITIFLFVVDVFWAYLLSSRYIAVLPTDEEKRELNKDNQKAVQAADW